MNTASGSVPASAPFVSAVNQRERLAASAGAEAPTGAEKDEDPVVLEELILLDFPEFSFSPCLKKGGRRVVRDLQAAQPALTQARGAWLLMQRKAFPDAGGSVLRESAYQ
ncbi:hypothetical protein cyc_03481 [Cyclospora cayetanensis]|uniref:Uncharacterized protein n=1 Tax=Cyclospora cayetanensis TaxID=88456 RepID=A0A1D3DB39_9EIME|nr:hypothetical protein cyc_03481 [Cyclospora cayetanensis]